MEGKDGRCFRNGLAAADRGYFTPVVPAVLAAQEIAKENFEPTGLVPPDRQTEPAALFDYLSRIGVRRISPS